jgi:Ca2+/Na+ antiporter
MIQLAIIAVGVILIWAERSRPNRNLRRDNWSSVVLLAIVIGGVVAEKISVSSFSRTNLFYTVLALVIYTAFVYLWNRHEPQHQAED